METKNMVVLIGRLVADPELRVLPSGDKVASFGLAVNRSVRNPDGSFEDKLDGYFDCDHYGATAERFAREFGKGALVQITGSLHQRSYKSGNGAGNRTVKKVEVKAKTVAPVLTAPKAQPETPTAAPAEAQPAVAVPQPA